MFADSSWSPLGWRPVFATAVQAATVSLLLLSGCQATAPAPSSPPVAPPPSTEDPWKSLPQEFRPFEVKAPRGGQRPSFAVRSVLREAKPGSFEVPTAEGTSLRVAAEILLTEQDVIKVEVHPPIEPTFYDFRVSIYFAPEAARRLHKASEQHLGEQLAFVLDGRVLIAPLINSLIDSPVLIANDFNREQAVRLAEQLAPR